MKRIDNVIISCAVTGSKMARSNADQVIKIRRILEDLSLEIATPDEARRMLDLKGAGSVGF